MSDLDITRPSLLLRLREPGNERAWEDFVRIYTPLIYGFARKRGLQDADAADVAQEVLRTVVRTIQRFEYDPRKGRFRGWLLTVTRSRLNDFFDRQRRQPATPVDTAAGLAFSEAPSAEETASWNRDYQQHLFEWAAEKVRAEVQPRTWDAFRLTAIEGRSGEAVAADLGLSVGAVYVAKSRVTARLRELILSIADEPPELAGEPG